MGGLKVGETNDRMAAQQIDLTTPKSGGMITLYSRNLNLILDLAQVVVIGKSTMIYSFTNCNSV